jgi:hypothetical protein
VIELLHDDEMGWKIACNEEDRSSQIELYKCLTHHEVVSVKNTVKRPMSPPTWHAYRMCSCRNCPHAAAGTISSYLHWRIFSAGSLLY